MVLSKTIGTLTAGADQTLMKAAEANLLYLTEGQESRDSRTMFMQRSSISTEKSILEYLER